MRSRTMKRRTAPTLSHVGRVGAGPRILEVRSPVAGAYAALADTPSVFGRNRRAAKRERLARAADGANDGRGVYLKHDLRSRLANDARLADSAASAGPRIGRAVHADVSWRCGMRQAHLAGKTDYFSRHRIRPRTEPTAASSSRRGRAGASQPYRCWIATDTTPGESPGAVRSAGFFSTRSRPRNRSDFPSARRRLGSKDRRVSGASRCVFDSIAQVVPPKPGPPVRRRACFAVSRARGGLARDIGWRDGRDEFAIPVNHPSAIEHRRRHRVRFRTPSAPLRQRREGLQSASSASRSATRFTASRRDHADADTAMILEVARPGAARAVRADMHARVSRPLVLENACGTRSAHDSR